MDAQSNAGQAALDQAARKRSRVVQAIDPAFPGVRGLRDLWQGWRDYRELWVTVGLYDIRKRYRRSLLGPFWITISLGAFILGLSFIYSPLVGGESGSFLPYVAFGFVAWQFVPHSCSTAAPCSSPTGSSFSSWRRRSASISIRRSGVI